MKQKHAVPTNELILIVSYSYCICNKLGMKFVLRRLKNSASHFFQPTNISYFYNTYFCAHTFPPTKHMYLKLYFTIITPSCIRLQQGIINDVQGKFRAKRFKTLQLQTR